jgi:hypothetical protein
VEATILPRPIQVASMAVRVVVLAQMVALAVVNERLGA